MASEEVIVSEEIKHLDFEPVCDVKYFPVVGLAGVFVQLGPGVQCAEPAHWRAVCIRCQGQHLICDQHHVNLFAFGMVACEYCGTVDRADQVFLVEALS